MPNPIALDIETPLAPGAVRAALLDFSPRRPTIWPGLSASLFKVYYVHENDADIQEGTALPLGHVWAREHYDWSKPDIIRWTVVESNFSAPGSYVQAELHERGDGGTRVRLEWNRTGLNLRGKLAVALIRLLRARPVRASFEAGLRKLEEPGSS
jgi:hypothetical protein